jgi:acylphosphatase
VKTTQHLLISGRVQGVSYRFFVQQSAEKLGVGGKVRNLSDGRVEAVLQGLPEKLEELHALLRRGPPQAEVKTIEVQVVQTHEDMKEFKITTDGDSPWLQKPQNKSQKK